MNTRLPSQDEINAAAGSYDPLALKLDQRKIDKARRALGAKTEQETVERALDMVLAEERLVRILKRGKNVGGFDDVFRR